MKKNALNNKTTNHHETPQYIAKTTKENTIYFFSI